LLYTVRVSSHFARYGWAHIHVLLSPIPYSLEIARLGCILCHRFDNSQISGCHAAHVISIVFPSFEYFRHLSSFGFTSYQRYLITLPIEEHCCLVQIEPRIFLNITYRHLHHLQICISQAPRWSIMESHDYGRLQGLAFCWSIFVTIKSIPPRAIPQIFADCPSLFSWSVFLEFDTKQNSTCGSHLLERLDFTCFRRSLHLHYLSSAKAFWQPNLRILAVDSVLEVWSALVDIVG
jgi:hypothetical protein